MKLNKVIFAISASVLALGSSSVFASSIDDDIAKPAQGKALVYVVHTDRFDAGNSVAMVINGDYMGHMTAGSYAKKEVEPGTVELLSRGENRSSLNFVAKPNETYYIKKVVRPGEFQSRSYLIMADKAEEEIAQNQIMQGNQVISGS